MIRRPHRYATLTGGYAPILWRRDVRGDEKEPCGAWYDPPSMTITINTTRTVAFQGMALLHELIHHTTQFPRLSPRDHYNVDEIVVDIVGRGLSNLWAANPAVFAWIHHAVRTK